MGKTNIEFRNLRGDVNITTLGGEADIGINGALGGTLNIREDQSDYGSNVDNPEEYTSSLYSSFK